MALLKLVGLFICHHAETVQPGERTKLLKLSGQGQSFKEDMRVVVLITPKVKLRSKWHRPMPPLPMQVAALPDKHRVKPHTKHEDAL